jgi:hypothetical protein
MTKKEQMFISAGAMAGGGILCGYALITTIGHPASTIFLVSGIAFCVIGFISLVLAVKRQQ